MKRQRTRKISILMILLIFAFGLLPGGKISAEAVDVTSSASLLSIDVARSRAATDEVTVKGIVTFVEGRNITIQDETAGIVARIPVADASILLGMELTVKGKRATFNGLEQINVETGNYYKGEVKAQPEPKEMTMEDLANAEKIEAVESQRIFVQGATIGAINTTGNTTLTKDGKSVNIYKVPALSGITEGDVVDVTAVVGQFTNYQLRVVLPEDVKLVKTVDFISIQEARALPKDEIATIKAIVTMIDSRNIIVQDATGAMVLFVTDADAAKLKLGMEVVATGKRGMYNNMEQLSVASGAVTPGFVKALPAPVLLTMSDLQNKEKMESLESHRIVVRGVTLGETNGNYTPITRDSMTFNIFKMPALENITSGDTVEVIGVVGQYKDTYQLRVADKSHVKLFEVIPDPVSEEDLTGATSLLDVYSLPTNQVVTTVGQIAYIYSGNTILLQDVIEDEVVGLQVYDYTRIDEFVIGDVVKITGTTGAFGGVSQVSKVTDIQVLGKKALFKPQEVTVKELLDNGRAFLSEYIVVKDAVLGKFVENGSTPITDGTGTINIYKGPAYPSGVKEGDTVNVYAASSMHYETVQLRMNASSDFQVVKDEVGPEFVLPEYLPAKAGRDYLVSATVVDNVSVKSVSVGVEINGVTSEPLTMVPDATTGIYQVLLPGTMLVKTNKMTLHFTAEDVNGNKTMKSAEIAVEDKPVILSVSPGANESTGENKKPLITVEFENAGENPEVMLTLGKDAPVKMTVSGNKAIYAVQEAMEDGRVQASIVITREDEISSEPYAWSFYIGEPLYNFYFGQLHAHTNYSDGLGTPDQALEYAKNAAQVDFLALTDHSNYFDTTSKLGTFDDPNSGSPSEVNAAMSKWAYYKSLFQKHQTEDFLPIYGFEMTWSGQYGHINTFNSNGFVSRNNSVLSARGGAGLKAYYELLKDQDGTFSQFNHPGPTFGTFEDFAHYDKLVDDKINLIEVGNGEGPVRGSGYFPSYQYYAQALDKGWHVAPSNGQDNHKGKWGDANTTRTVVIADALTLPSFQESIENLMVYSTEDNNFEIFYTANDMPMGTRFEEDLEELDILVEFSDPDAVDVIGKVSIMVNGGLAVHEERINTNTGKMEVTIPNEYSYYYIMVEQGDGDIAVTAPVWTGAVTQVGINDLSKDTAMDVKGETTKLLTHMYNYEEKDFQITKMEYLVDGAPYKILTTGLPVIAKGTTSTVEFNFVPEKLGKQTITMNMEGTLDGLTMAFTRSITLNVYDNKNVVDILVDAAHDNFYVSGDYANNDTYFTQVAGEKGARVKRVNDEITPEILEGIELLMLTVPYKGFGRELKNYTQSEIDAIRTFAQNGGNIILSSKSDRGNPGGDANAAVISNRILEAIGAKARIADGIVVDNEKKSNEAYRLVFKDEENFNDDTMFGKGILTQTTKTFNAYNSAPVLLNGATPIITGYESTWGANYTENFTGSAYIPDYEKDKVVVEKGEVALVSEEILPGGGFLLASGVTFFSNFEVTVEMLIEESVRNANFQILNNVIDEIKPEPEIVSIKAVQEAEEGLQFTIKGRLTSNVSGFDRSTAFFDSAYIQDETGGINIFPIDGNYEAGTLIQITGITSSYQGEHQLNIESMKVMEEPVVKVQPTLMTTKEVPDHLGLLVAVEGLVRKITSKEGVVESIMVEDRSGTAIRVFIDGYIGTAVEMPNIEEGDFIHAIGLSSIDPEGNRIRVRDRSEIKLVQKATSKTALENIIKEAEDKDLANMTEASVEILTKAVEKGIVLLEDVYARQEEVDGAVTNIQDAIKQLTEKEQSSETIKNETEKVLEALAKTPVKGTLIVDARENKKIDKAIFEALKGQDKTIVFETENAVWSFNGKDIKNVKDIDLGVTIAPIASCTSKNAAAIKKAVKGEDVLVISFRDNGVLPGKAVVRIKLDEQWLKGKDKNNLYVYYYNAASKKVETVAKKIKVDSEGYVELTITHNSDYFIADKDLQAAGILPKTGSENAMRTTLPLGMIFIGAGAMLFLYEKKKLVKNA